jgi:hypothetical protein
MEQFFKLPLCMGLQESSELCKNAYRQREHVVD